VSWQASGSIARVNAIGRRTIAATFMTAPRQRQISRRNRHRNLAPAKFSIFSCLNVNSVAPILVRPGAGVSARVPGERPLFGRPTLSFERRFLGRKLPVKPKTAVCPEQPIASSSCRGRSREPEIRQGRHRCCSPSWAQLRLASGYPRLRRGIRGKQGHKRAPLPP